MEFTELKERIEAAKAKKARAEGVIEQVEKQLKEDYNLTPDQIRDEVDKLEKELNEEQARYEELIKKAEDMING